MAKKDATSTIELKPAFASKATPKKGEVRVYVGDCRKILPALPEMEKARRTGSGPVDLVFADPPFNWNSAYDRWHDAMPEADYLDFTFTWLSDCAELLRPGGAFWVNIPDDWAAEIVCFMKGRLERKPPAIFELANWCVWHYRFGQNSKNYFINSKVHALYFVKPALPGQKERTWNPEAVLEVSDRASIYGDPRTLSKKDGMPAGLRLPMDVWYGKHWGRIQGNNKERRDKHDNQLPEVYLERVIKACSNPGDLVLDPFLGSGTTGVVARELGRNFIGTEFSAENAKRAYERVVEIGPIRDLHASKPESTAIFEARRSLKVES